MRQRRYALGGAAAVLATMLVMSPAARAADVHIGVNVGVPPPPVIAAPPPLVAVPSLPAVQYAPEYDNNLFVYGGRLYTVRDDAWFVAPSYGAPWAYVPRARVPRPVLVVPARYYRVPPGHAKHYRRDYDDDWHRHGHDHGHGQHHDHDGKHGHGHDD